MCSSDLEVNPELAKKCDDYLENMKNEKKRLKAQYRIERDEKLKAMGLENCDQDTIEKIIEVQTLSRKLEEETLKGAKTVLKEAQGTSEAVASEAVASEATASEAVVSEAAKTAKVNHSLVPQTSPLSSSSSSTDSDLDDIPLSQKYN